MKFFKRSKEFFQKIFSSKDMEGDDVEPSDLLCFITEELQTKFQAATDMAEKSQIIQDFLKRWESDRALDVLRKQKFEFEKDLDWFNVSHHLTLEGLRGKLLVLDFFTYCCINCMHILPELNNLEKLYPIERGLVVVGVHSPKFENEKDAVNILAAVQRYGIEHPIVNDPTMSLWRSIGVRCWPTLIVLAPTGAPMLMLMGEGHGIFMEHFTEQALRFFAQKKELKDFSIPIRPSIDLLPASKLKFPAKIARSEDGRFAIADAGNHRIVVFNIQGDVLHKIGCGSSGLVDGHTSVARFNCPQGVTFLNNEILIVADTENHALRQVNLRTQTVETLAGTGQQGHDRTGGKIGPLQQISSPWDVAVYRTRDMDMSFHLDEQNVPEKTIILSSMAGTHQIWGYFPEGMIWWKFRKFEPRTCVSLIGNGMEENRNNSYPQNAAFAQPSGLAIAKDFLYVADSESSSIRKASLVDGKVLGVVGGDRNPQNLFAFGDEDGKQFSAKLQHPLGICYNHFDGKIYIADTYNHKIKVIDTENSAIDTCNILRQDGAAKQLFNEPAGLCFDATGQYLLISDTNNHQLICVDMYTSTAQQFPLKFPWCPGEEECVIDGPLRTGLEIVRQLPLTKCKQIKLLVSVTLDQNLKFTAEAPQKWSLNSANSALKSLNTRGSLTNGKFDILLQRVDMANVNIPREDLKLDLSLSLCDAKSCLMKRFAVILNDDDNALSDNTASNTEEIELKLHITPNSVHMF
ncbi:NHL repeat-containing protein 2 [Stomoxys calcitrans]|uniref:Thioredoxin domain-containing protein n=1 Tax=Stomoxys calcitrans TaxID=35570 RepID=A0A1I8QB78_STOCA|nr:NHL repeat-containing protein 2 [Stomoxys calcitrans]